MGEPGKTVTELAGGSSNPDFDWQGTKTNVKGRLSYLFMSDVFSDIRFIVGKEGSKQKIPAHRLVLSMSSSVFNVMFNGSLPCKFDEIELPDVEPEALIAFLKYIYTDEIEVTIESALPTLYTAKKYAVPSLEKACVEFIMNNVNPSNAFFFLHQGRLFEETQLINKCLATVDENPAASFSSDGFLDVDLGTVCSVFERSTCNVGIGEVDIFRAALRWAGAECKRKDLTANAKNFRKVLDRAFGMIRFPLMTLKEFTEGASAYELPDKEIVDLFQSLLPDLKSETSGSLSCQPRESEPLVFTVSRSFTEAFAKSSTNAIKIRYESSGDKRTIFDFNAMDSTSRVLLKGFEIFGSKKRERSGATIRLTKRYSSEVGRCSATFLSDGSTRTYSVMFREAIEISPSTTYVVDITLNEGFGDYYVGTSGKGSVPVVDCFCCPLFNFVPSTTLVRGNPVTKEGQILSKLVIAVCHKERNAPAR